MHNHQIKTGGGPLPYADPEETFTLKRLVEG